MGVKWERQYTRGMKPPSIILFLLAFTASMPVAATEVFHWVDENGVQNFSQQAPGSSTSGVSQLTLDGMAPPGYDPEEDRYGVAIWLCTIQFKDRRARS